MPPPPTSLNTLVQLVQNIVPESRHSQKLRDELIAQCQDVLSSRIGHNREPDIAHLTDLVKRHLSQNSQSTASTLRFTNLLSRLLEQPVLSRKHASVQFLHSLASSAPSTSTTPAFLPTLAPPRSLKPPPQSLPVNGETTSAKKPVGKSKAEILRKYRAKIGQPHLPEDALLRDALYILQGISGKYVKLVEVEDEVSESKLVFADDPHYIISPPNRTLIHRLAELGHLYSRVATFVRDREGRPGVGMIEQSLCHYLESQLTEYYRLIAVLESQMHVSRNNDGSAEAKAVEEETGLTLKRLEVWIDDWRLRLRMMSVCVEGCRDVSGGALVNLIHSYTENGDPFVRKVTDELLEEESSTDPFSEFFVHLDPGLAHVQYIQQPGLQQNGAFSTDEGFSGVDNDDLSREYQGGLRLWESKYVFREEMLPAFVGEDFGRKIFSTGKSLNFIRYSCHDSDWVATRKKLDKTGGTLQYSDIAGLEHSIDTAYSIASQRLFDVFFEKFGLLVHMKALKNYMFLGHGDFADSLMDSLGPHLSRPANTLYRHNLTAKLEEAIRSTNAQNDPQDVLRRLDARMLEYTHGEIGWDVFTLEYKVDAPIDTVLDSDTMIKYLRVFSHLWKMKRVEGALTTGWMRVAGGSRTFLRIHELDIEWHQIRLALAEMVHFLRQVQAYCHLEVIECQWKKLMEFIHKKEGGLDALIAAHRSYVDAIDKKILLWYPKSGKEENLLRQIRELFEIILQFRIAMDDFYNYTLAESARQESQKRDQGRGLYTDPRSEREQAVAREALPRILQRTREYGSTFSEKVQALVLVLAAHPDLDCKYLGIRLSFSDFYKTRRDKEGTPKTS
ncbi:gamma-tubulin complex, DGRIP91/SPC98 component [Phellopilus nigrolimitatus]|nr:gamma-tubulin complex, DGRIP91/SPC98 component [Phellopilus nigrolimitatus]